MNRRNFFKALAGAPLAVATDAASTEIFDLYVARAINGSFHVYKSNNNRLWALDGGAWREVPAIN